MAFIDALRFRLRQLRHRPEVDGRMDEEFRFHMEMETEKNVRAGMDPVEARRRAALSFGGLEGHRETMRSERSFAALDQLLREIRYAFRSLRRTPGSSAAAVGALALGIGAATTVFALVNWILLRPVPGVADQDELVVIRMAVDSTNETGISFLNYLDLRREVDAFTAFTAYQTAGLQLALEDGTQHNLIGEVVAGDYFGALGVRPHIGRFLTSDEYDSLDPTPVVVIGWDLWWRIFQGAPDVLGRQANLNGTDYTIVGVAPKNFRGTERLGWTEAWVPVSNYGLIRHAPSMAATERRPGVLNPLVGRLRPGATAELAEQQLRTAVAGLVERYPEINDLYRTYLPTVHSEIGLNHRTIGSVTRISRLFLILGGVLLLIAYANVSNLVLIRGLRRRSETAVRRALGASTFRLVRSNIAEGVLVALAGSVLGLALALGATRLFRDQTVIGLPRFTGLSLDWRVIAFATAVAILCGILFGLLPGRLASARDFLGDLKESARSNTGSGSALRGILTGAQIAGCLVLVVGSLLLTQTVRRLSQVDVGYDRERVIAFGVDPDAVGYTWDQVTAFRTALLEAVQAQPGVESASITSHIPFGGGYPLGRYAPLDEPDREPVLAYAPANTPGYLETLGIPLYQGQAQASAEIPDGVVISRALAEALFGEESAVGKRITTRARTPQTHTVIGVADNTRMRSLRGEVDYVVYRTMDMLLGFETATYLVVRTALPHATIERQVREVLADIDPSLVLFRTELLSAGVERSIAEERMLTRLMVGLTLLALLLASVGVYSVVTYSVAQRTREFGIRIALGASGGRIARLVFDGFARTALLGILAGALAAGWATRLLESRLFGIERLDPATFIAAAVALVAIAAAASLVPARAATRVHPIEAIRAE